MSLIRMMTSVGVMMVILLMRIRSQSRAKYPSHGASKACGKELDRREGLVVQHVGHKHQLGC